MQLDEQIVVTKVFNIKPNKDSDEVKQWTLELTIPSGTMVIDMARSILATEVIKTQNGNRNKFDKYPSGHVFKRTFQKPGTSNDPETDVMAKAASDKQYALDMIEKLKTQASIR